VLLAKAREKVGTERVWLKAAKLERELNNIATELDLLDQVLSFAAIDA
jgi:hypothetical protein